MTEQAGTMVDTPSGAFAFDGAVAPAADLVTRWRQQIGARYAFPHFSSATLADFRWRMEVTRVQDAVALKLISAAPSQTAGPPCRDEEFVRAWIVRRGECALGGAREDSMHLVPAGGFLIRHAEPLAHFKMSPRTRAEAIILPAAAMTHLIGAGAVTGSARSAEVRLLAAHAEMVRRTHAELGSAGAEAARNVLVELALAVVRGGVDTAEPRLGPALAGAAKTVARRFLTEPGFTPAVLARELNVSVRTLQRAFAATGDSVMGYVREQRLEAVRGALVANRLSVSEAAARWQFADSSHLHRAFKRRYGQTPAEYVRTARRAPVRRDQAFSLYR